MGQGWGYNIIDCGRIGRGRGIGGTHLMGLTGENRSNNNNVKMKGERKWVRNIKVVRFCGNNDGVRLS